VSTGLFKNFFQTCIAFAHDIINCFSALTRS
jgi:hypothetical protein